MLLFNIVMISYPIYRAFTIINMRKADGTCSVFRYLFILFRPFDTPVLKSCIQRFINVICILCFPVRYQCWKEILRIFSSYAISIPCINTRSDWYCSYFLLSSVIWRTRFRIFSVRISELFAASSTISFKFSK